MKARSLLLVLVTLAALPASAAQPLTSTADEISRAVTECPQLTIFDDVNGQLEGGVVVLTGRVTAAEKKAALQKSVSRIPGVRVVRDEIAVLPASSADDELRRRVARAIYGNPSFWSYAALPRPPIRIIVERRHVTLKGTVGNHVERTLARSLASGQGELSVVNELRTDPGR